MRGMITAAALVLSILPVASRASPPHQDVRVEADGSRTLVHDAVVPAPIAQVWAAISTPEGWRTWAVPFAHYVPGEADVMETSYQLRARPGDPSNLRQRIVARLPERLLVFRTVRAPPGFPHANAFYGVTNFIELAPDGAGTRVRLTGADYPPGVAGDELLRFFRTGNKATLQALRRRFTSGPVDWSEQLRERSR